MASDLDCLFLFGLEYLPQGKSDFISGEKRVPNLWQKKFPVSASLGFAYHYPLAEQEPSFGPHLELETSKIILGLGFHQGSNKVQTLSKGAYAMVPVYGLWKVSCSDKIDFLLGGGYSFNSNKIDPEAVSLLTAKGYLNSQEIILSGPLLIVGAQVAAPYSDNSVKLSLRYCYHQPIAVYLSEQQNFRQKIDLSSLELAARVSF